MRKSINKLISTILSVSTILTSLASTVVATDSGGHVGIGGSTNTGSYTQASDAQISAGFTATDTASGLKMSVLRFAYADENNNRYRTKGALTGKTALGSVPGYAEEAQETFGTMPVYFEYGSSSSHPKSEAYVSDEGILCEFDITNYLVNRSSSIDSSLSAAYSRIYSTFTGLNFNAGGSLGENAIVDGILKDGEIETMSDNDIKYNMETYRALAYMVLSKYSDNGTETYAAIKQLYETGNPVYNGYEYIFLLEPLAALNKQGSSGRFFITPNSLGQYYLKSEGLDVRDSVFKIGYNGGNVAYIQNTTKWKIENKTTGTKIGFGFVFDWVYGWGSTTSSILKKMWFTGYIIDEYNASFRATQENNMYGWGTLRPLDHVKPVTDKFPAITTTVARVGLADDSDIFACSYTADKSITGLVQRASDFVQAVETMENGKMYKSMNLLGRLNSALVSEKVSMLAYLTMQSRLDTVNYFIDGDIGLDKLQEVLANYANTSTLGAKRADITDDVLTVEYDEGTRFVTDVNTLKNRDEVLNDKVIVGIGTVLIDYRDTLSSKQADYLTFSEAAKSIKDAVKNGTIATTNINDSRIGFGYKGTGGKRYIKVWQKSATELMQESVVNVLNNKSVKYAGEDLPLRSLYSLDGGVGLYNTLGGKFGVQAIADAIRDIVDAKGSIASAGFSASVAKLLGAEIPVSAMYYTNASAADIVSSGVSLGVNALIESYGLASVEEQGILDDNTVIKNGTASSGVIIMDDDAANINIIGVRYNKETEQFEQIDDFNIENAGKIPVNAMDAGYIPTVTVEKELKFNGEKYTVDNAVVIDNNTDVDSFLSRLTAEYKANGNKLKSTTKANDNNNEVPVIKIPDDYTREKYGYMVALGTDGTLQKGDTVTVVFVCNKQAKVKLVEITDSLDPTDPEVEITGDEDLPDVVKIEDKLPKKLVEWFTTTDKTDSVDESVTWDEVKDTYKPKTSGTTEKEIEKDKIKEDTTIFVRYKTSTKFIEVYEDNTGNVIRVDTKDNFELPFIVKDKTDASGVDYKVKNWAVLDGEVVNVNSWSDVISSGLTVLKSDNKEAFIDVVTGATKPTTTLAVRYQSDKAIVKVVKIYDANGSRAENTDFTDMPIGTSSVTIANEVDKNGKKYQLVEWFVTEEPVTNNATLMWDQAVSVYPAIKNGNTPDTINITKGTVIIKYTNFTVNKVVVIEDEKGNTVKTDVTIGVTLPVTIDDTSTSPSGYKLQEWKIVGKYLQRVDLVGQSWSSIQSKVGSATVVGTGTNATNVDRNTFGTYSGPVTIMIRYRKEATIVPNDVTVTGKFTLEQNEITKMHTLKDFNGSLGSAYLYRNSFNEHSDTHRYTDYCYCYSCGGTTCYGHTYTYSCSGCKYDSTTGTWYCDNGYSHEGTYYNITCSSSHSCSGHTYSCTHYCDIDWSDAGFVNPDVSARFGVNVVYSDAIAASGSLGASNAIRDNKSDIPFWDYATSDDRTIIPDDDFVIHRGKDKVTLASWINNISELTAIGYGVDIKPQYTRAVQSYVTNAGLMFSLAGDDLALARKCYKNIPNGGCSNDYSYSWYHDTTTPANVYSNNINYSADEAVNKYTDLIGYGTATPGIVANNMRINGINFSAANLTATSGGIGNVTFYPYVKMNYQDLSGANKDAYVLAEHTSTVAFNSAVYVGWAFDNENWIDIRSNQFSTHKKAVNAHGKDSVIPGGAVMNITADGRDSTKIGMVGYSAYISDDLYNKISGMDSSLNGKSLSTAKNEMMNTWNQLKDSTLNSVKLQMYASTNDSVNKYYNMSGEVDKGVRFNGTTLSSDTKYWFIDGVRQENNSYNIKFASGSEDRNYTYYKVGTIKETGELALYKSTDGTSWSILTKASAGSWNNILSNAIAKEIDDNTKLITNMISAMEQCNGNGGWYTELWDGFCVVKCEFTIGLGIEAPTTRSHVIDVKLTPELKNKADMFSKYFAACYKLKKTSEIYTTFKGTKLTLKGIDNNGKALGGSRVFYIPNVTVSDLGNN